MSGESIFEDDELQADALAPDADAPAVEEQPEPGPERDEHGRFKPKEPEPETPEVPEEGKTGLVPQQALHSEREKRKASDARADAIEAELKAAREQLEAIAAMRKQIAERKPEPLPAADDPAAMEHLRTRLAETEGAVNRIGQERDMEVANSREMQEIGNVMARSEEAFRQAKPDYDAAIDHVVNARAKELQLYGLPPAQIQLTIAEEAADIVRSAVQQGRDPAELGYQIALSRGYRPQEPAQQQEQPQGGAAAQLAAIAKAQGANKSLGNGGGSSPQKINAEALAGMTDDEFAALYSTPEGRAMIDAL